jgi:hypothetical protein
VPGGTSLTSVTVLIMFGCKHACFSICMEYFSAKVKACKRLHPVNYLVIRFQSSQFSTVPTPHASSSDLIPSFLFLFSPTGKPIALYPFLPSPSSLDYSIIFPQTICTTSRLFRHRSQDGALTEGNLGSVLHISTSATGANPPPSTLLTNVTLPS